MDHMRKAHRTPSFVTAGNLARWFPPWTVTREQWRSVNRPSVSGIAVDTFLFSSIGVPLFHHYQVYDRQGSHIAFRGTYMYRMFDFLQEADAQAVRREDMSPGTYRKKKNQTARTPSRKVRRTSVAGVRGHGGVTPVAETRKVTVLGAGQDQVVDEDTVQALMELALPRFHQTDKNSDGLRPKGRPQPVMLNSPASPASDIDGIRALSSSPGTNVEVLSSVRSDVDVTPLDNKIKILCYSYVQRAPEDGARSSSDDGLSSGTGRGDRRSVFKNNSTPLERTVSMYRPEPVEAGKQDEIEETSLMNREVVDVLPEWSDSDLEPLISPDIGPMDITGSSRQRFFGMLSPQPPATISANDGGDSSATPSPNHVREERSQVMPTEEGVFDVPPDLSGIRRRRDESALKLPVHTQTASPVYKGITDPFFGVPC